MLKFPKNRNLLIGLLVLVLTFVSYSSAVFAQTSPTIKRNFYNRAEIVSRVIEAFEIKNSKADFIKSCMQNRNDCFFVFSIISNYQGMKLDPLILYPDIAVSSRYYNDINIATMLGLTHGHVTKNGAEFRPRAYMTRMHALKVLMGAAEFMTWKEKFELGDTQTLKTQKTIFKDINLNEEGTWWYPRYLNLALEKGIISENEFFRPNDRVTVKEFETMLNRALKI